MITSSSGSWVGATDCSIGRSAINTWTIAATVRMSNSGVVAYANGFLLSGAGGAAFGFQRNGTSTSQLYLIARQSGSSAAWAFTVNTTVARVIVRRDGSGNRAWSVDGAAVTTNSTAPAIAARSDYALSAAAVSMEAAECAIWGRALTDDEMVAYGKGLIPLKMPASLLGYWPLVRDGNSRIGGENVNMTNASGTVIAHPRTYR